MFPENDLISILKQKDAQFVLFCKGLEGKIAQDEDLAFLLSGEQEINEILNEIDLKISVTSDEKEKENLLKEKSSWLREREAYHREIQRIQNQMKKKHQAASNGRYFLSEEERAHYARIIYLITIYDEQKQKLKLDGSLSSEELEDLIQNLHHIQEKINMFYQAIFKTSDVLEEESILPRMKNIDESSFQYENYVREFFGLDAKEEEKISVDDLVSFMETNPTHINKDEEIVPTENVPEPTNLEEETEEPMPIKQSDRLFDCWLDEGPYQKILNSPWIKKIMETQNESLGYFIQFIKPMGDENKDYLDYQIDLLRNSALQIETEFMDKELFQESKEEFSKNFIFDRDELAKRGYEPRKTYLFSSFSSLFQAIYLYDKLKLNEKENMPLLMKIRDKINLLSANLLRIKELIPITDLQDLNETIDEDIKIYPDIGKQNKEDTPPEKKTEDIKDLKSELEDFEKIKNYCQERIKNNLDIPVDILEKYNDGLKKLPEMQQQLGILTPVTEEPQDEKYASLMNKIGEIENKLNYIMSVEEKKKKGKPYKVIRKATNNILLFINRHKVLSIAIGAISLAMISFSSAQLNKTYEPVNVVVDNVNNNFENDQILHYVVKTNDQKNVEPEIKEEEYSAKEVEENDLLPQIGNTMHPKLGILVYPDQYVGLGKEKNGHLVNYAPSTNMVISKLGFMDSFGVVHSAKSNEEAMEYARQGYQLVSCFDDTYGYFSINDVEMDRESRLGL